MGLLNSRIIVPPGYKKDKFEDKIFGKQSLYTFFTTCSGCETIVSLFNKEIEGAVYHEVVEEGRGYGARFGSYGQDHRQFGECSIYPVICEEKKEKKEKKEKLTLVWKNQDQLFLPSDYTQEEYNKAMTDRFIPDYTIWTNLDSARLLHQCLSESAKSGYQGKVGSTCSVSFKHVQDGIGICNVHMLPLSHSKKEEMMRTFEDFSKRRKEERCRNESDK